MAVVRFVGYVLAALALLALVAFAVSNRDLVVLKLFPFPYIIETPVYLALTSTLVLGIVVGGTIIYFSNLGVRLTLRSVLRQRRNAEREPQSVSKPEQ